MSAHDLETLIGAALLIGSGLSCLYALPTWISHRGDR